MSIEDDGYAPERAIHALVDLYKRAQGDVARVLPRETGARHIGHFGWFSPRHRATLWAGARDWLFEKGGVAR